MPDRTIKAIENKVLAYLTPEEVQKLKDKQGKIVCLDGLWYFLDMGGGKNEQA
jgi:hypothetical protein